jgi:hypothetical protein
LQSQNKALQDKLSKGETVLLESHKGNSRRGSDTRTGRKGIQRGLRGRRTGQDAGGTEETGKVYSTNKER